MYRLFRIVDRHIIPLAMAKPLIAVETIYDAALRLLDEQGADALSARNLAAALKCSTRTLYQQVGKREELISKLITYHLSSLDLEFRAEEHWQDSVRSWSSTIRSALLAHPNLYHLMTLEHRAPIADYATELLKTLLGAGIEEELALRSCRVLANITISLTLAELKSPPAPVRQSKRRKKEIQFEDLVISRSKAGTAIIHDPPEVFNNTINWVIAGIEGELAGAGSGTR